MLEQAGWRILMGVLITVGLSVSHVWSIDTAEATQPLKAEAPKGPRAIIKTKLAISKSSSIRMSPQSMWKILLS